MARKSNVDKLPADARLALQAMLADPGLTQAEITVRINALLAEFPEAGKLSKSGVGRYALSMRDLVDKKQEAAEAVSFWRASLGDIPDGDFGRAITEILRTLSFDISMAAHRGFDPNDVPGAARMLKDMAMAMEKLESAASKNEQRDALIRKQAREELAQEATKAAKAEGVSEQGLARIREALGMEA